MAVYPCFLCLERFQGEAQNLYLNYFTKDRAVKLRLVLCPGCLADLTTPWLGRALHPDEEGRWVDPAEDETLESLLEAPAASLEAFRFKKVS